MGLSQFLYENTVGTAEERISVLENRSEEITQNVDERHGDWKYWEGLVTWWIERKGIPYIWRKWNR